MSYDYDYVQYWGSHEGVARGLPTKVYEKDSSSSTEIYWGLKYSEKRVETKSVQTKLWPGTAINVTLKGNYVTLEAPYSAKLYAFYAGSEDSISRKILSEVSRFVRMSIYAIRHWSLSVLQVRKSYLKDVKLEFSPVYWIENGTFVPTTTTTSTTSTTTHATTTAGNPTPIHEPPVVLMKDLSDTNSAAGSLESSMLDSPASNEIPHDKPDNLAEHHPKPAMTGIDLPHNSAASTSLAQALAYIICFIISVNLGI